MAIKNRLNVAKLALKRLREDRDERLKRIDNYVQGKQDLPYTPDSADAEFIALAQRSITNILGFIVSTPAQLMYVDAFRRGRTSDNTAEFGSEATDAVQPEWDHWQNSRLDARQAAIMRGALTFGHAFALTEKDKKRDRVLTKGLSALTTIALYEDMANDDDPYAALHITKWPEGKGDKAEFGKARMWDDTYEYEVTFKSLEDTDSVKVATKRKRHGATECPVTRFATAVDLEGRTCGVVEPMLVLQDRINQTVFDLLIVQSYASFKVRTISGMAPPIKMKAIDADGNTVRDPANRQDDIADWVPVIDPVTGRPVPDDINVNAKRLFFAEDHDTKFGTLDETPLDGFIAAIELAFRNMAALSQTPPHAILGEIANLSAEALEAAETALLRKVEEFQASFGESWERVFRIAAQIDGLEGADDFAGEVIWRDMGNASIAQAADALGKLHESLGVPQRGLWRRIPNVTANELAEWDQLDSETNPDRALAEPATRAGASTRPSFRLATTSMEDNAA